jgi:hypothetical protein
MTGIRVSAGINYAGPMDGRPAFHANDKSLDRLALESRLVAITDARTLDEAPSLAREGFALLPCPTRVRDFRDQAEVAHVYADEVQRFMAQLTGADAVVVTGPGVLRFGEASGEAGSRDNSHPARFIHIDTSDAAAADFARRSAPPGRERFRRVAQHNIWRTFSPPPQDVPLALCDARTVAPEDLVPADARFDQNGEVRWSFEALLLRHNPAHRWCFYSDMHRDEVLIFKRNDTDRSEPHWVPHSAFDDARVAPGGTPRASIEMRTIAYWFE